MNGDQNDVALAKHQALGVYAGYTGFERDVVVFWSEEFGIDAFVFEVGDDASGNFAGVVGFAECAVGGALSWSEEAVAVVDKDFHWCCVWGNFRFLMLR